MSMHIYAFGSVCRGDISYDSDVDLLAVVDGLDSRFDPDVYSIYSKQRLTTLWNEGNPFAWHLSCEAVLLHSADGRNFLSDLGTPAPYTNTAEDCTKFWNIFRDAAAALRHGTSCRVFELSVVFLAVRNIATCYSLAAGAPDFSRNSAQNLVDMPITLEHSVYSVLSRARTLSTRGRGGGLTEREISRAIDCLDTIDSWMSTLVRKAAAGVRVSV